MMTENENSPSRRIDDVRPAVALEWEKPAEETVEPPARATQWTILLTSAGHGLVHAYGQPFADVKPHQQCINVVDEAVVVELRERVQQLEAALAAQPVAASAAGPHDLRAAVKQMACALRNGEWADLLTMDPDAAELEKQIERLLATQSAKQGAQAGIVQVPRDTLLAIYEAMNYMGDILNGMDACEEEDEEATTPAFNAMRDLLDGSYVPGAAAQAAPERAAQVAQECAPVAEVRDQVLEEAAEQCKPGLIANATAYEIAAIQKCANAIRALKSTTNKSEG